MSKVNRLPKSRAPTNGGNGSSPPSSLHLDLEVHDRDTIAELVTIRAGAERDTFALSALRIGVLALRQARGQVDAEAVKRECERMLTGIDGELKGHALRLNDRLTAVLKEYFDPRSGKFEERVNRFVRKDGEMEQVLRRQLGGQDSELVRTLAAHVGRDSPLMRVLDPGQAKGLVASLRRTVEEQLAAQRERVLREFSLDNDQGALRRLVRQLTENQGRFTKDLQGQVDKVLKQLTLDEEGSGLSRLIKSVADAQKQITKQFSLDEKASALSRLKGELMEVLHSHEKTNAEFQKDLRSAVDILVARRKEIERSTRHGVEFEDAVWEEVQQEAQKKGDLAERTGSQAGLIRNSKIGDCVVTLGPDSIAPEGKVVVEAKEVSGYDLKKARREIEQARKNRGAQVGLFVFSRKAAPDGIEPLARYGTDVFVTWDPENPADPYLRAGLAVARALCIASSKEREAQAVDFQAIVAAILEVEKQAKSLEEVKTWTATIQRTTEKIAGRVGKAQKSLLDQVEVLNDKVTDLKAAIGEGAAGSRTTDA